MTPSDLQATITAYGAGLEVELSLLEQLEGLAAQETDASVAANLARVAEVSAAREQAMASLLAVDAQIRPLRLALADHRAMAASLPGFADIAARHRLASQLVTIILGADQKTLEILRHAAAARQAASQALENGGQTLAAYRRVIAPPLAGAALIDERG